MNAPDLRDFDFDACRRRAETLRDAAIDGAFNRTAAALRSLLSPRPRQVESRHRVPATHCPA